MKKIFTLIVIVFALQLFVSCKEKKSAEEPATIPCVDSLLTNDHTIYGLACDGCTDSTMYLLPEDMSDPIAFDVLNAFRNHKVMGKLRIGDWVGIVRNEADSTVADLVIDLELLKGTWCYVVMPQMRQIAGMPKGLPKSEMKEIRDSIKENFMVPREYGFTLKRQWAVRPVGMVYQNNTLETQAPVEYPTLPCYFSWHINNGRLVLSRNKDNTTMNIAGKKMMKASDIIRDTADIVFLNDDSLVLRFADYQRSYYRISNADDANKLAREKAAKAAKDAMNELTEEKQIQGKSTPTHSEEKEH